MQENLTAWIDGELSPRWTDRVDRHLASCAACASEAYSLRAMVGLQRATLPGVAAVDDFDVLPVRMHLQRALAAETERPEPTWGWAFRPFAIAGAALAAAIVLLFLIAGGPKAVLIPLGVQSPPPAVSHAPDLFKDYPLIEDLDALENFDTVESVPLDEDQASQRG